MAGFLASHKTGQTLGVEEFSYVHPAAVRPLQVVIEVRYEVSSNSN